MLTLFHRKDWRNSQFFDRKRFDKPSNEPCFRGFNTSVSEPPLTITYAMFVMFVMFVTSVVSVMCVMRLYLRPFACECA